MEIRARAECGIWLIFRYLRARNRSAFWSIWLLAAAASLFGARGAIEGEGPLPTAALIVFVLCLTGLFTLVIYPLFVLLYAVVAVSAGGRHWEYVVNAEGVAMSGGAVTYSFKWDELRRVKKHEFGWRLWFGRKGFQVLVPRKAFDDRQAALFESWSGYVLHRTQEGAPATVTAE